MKYIVKLVNNGQEYWLRGTTWAFFEDRAFRYDSPADAQAALDNARKFMKPKLYKLAEILEVKE